MPGKDSSEWAVITGASSGIGRELAWLFARDKTNLYLVARNLVPLGQLADELSRHHGIEARPLSVDLSLPSASEELFAKTKGTDVSTLVNNAGFGHYGEFGGAELRVQREMMQVNMVALAELTHLFLQPMLKRARGRILNVGSVAGFQPGPSVNIYYATKAFVFSFSYALADELAGSGVTVTVLCPGTTRTGFFDRANIHMKRPWPMMNAETVALAGYRGMLRGNRVVIPGFVNRVMATISPCLPSRLTAAIVRRVHAKR